MIILSPSQAQAFVKAKYTKRWKGKDGKWHYEYAKPARSMAGQRALVEMSRDEAIKKVGRLVVEDLESMKQLGPDTHARISVNISGLSTPVYLHHGVFAIEEPAGVKKPTGTKKQKPLSDKETSKLMSSPHSAPMSDIQIQAMGQQLGDDILDIMDSDVFVGLTLKDYGVANTKKLFRAAYYAADKKSKETQGLGVKDRHGSGVNAIVRRATAVAERLASKGTKVPK